MDFDIDQFHVTVAIMIQRSIGVKTVDKTSLHLKHTETNVFIVAVTFISSLKEVFMNLLVRKDNDDGEQFTNINKENNHVSP